MPRKKMRNFNVTVDAKYSYDFNIKAIDVRTAKKIAAQRFKRKMNSRNCNCYVDEYDEDGYMK